MSESSAPQRPPLNPCERASFCFFFLPIFVQLILLEGVAFIGLHGSLGGRSPNLHDAVTKAWGTARFSGLTVARFLPPEADQCSGTTNNTCPPTSATDAFWAMCESCLRPTIVSQLRSAQILAGFSFVLSFGAVLLVPLHSSGARRCTPLKRKWIAVAAYALLLLTLGLVAIAARLTVGATQSYAPIANTPFRGYPNSTSMGEGYTTASDCGTILTAVAAILGCVGAGMLVAELVHCGFVRCQRSDGGYGALSAGGA